MTSGADHVLIYARIRKHASNRPFEALDVASLGSGDEVKGDINYENKGSTIVTATMLAGCGLTMQSDDRIRVNTAGVLGLSPDELTIENKRQEVSTTYYLAKTKSGIEYACTIMRTPLYGFGLPPNCNKKGEPAQSTSPLR